MKKQYLDSGKIVGTHGIKGEVRIEPWCDSPAFLSAFKKLYLDENGTSFIEVKSRPHKNITLAKIKGVDAIEDAERYRGKIVYINRDDIRHRRQRQDLSCARDRRGGHRDQRGRRLCAAASDERNL